MRTSQGKGIVHTMHMRMNAVEFVGTKEAPIGGEKETAKVELHNAR